MSRSVFVLADGDQIRARVERLLFDRALEDLSIFSKSLIDAIEAIKLFAISAMSAEVILAGGDDFILRLESPGYLRENLLRVSEIFKATCGSSLSIGVGDSIEAAYIALRQAKSRGGGQIVEQS